MANRDEIKEMPKKEIDVTITRRVPTHAMGFALFALLCAAIVGYLVIAAVREPRASALSANDTVNTNSFNLSGLAFANTTNVIDQERNKTACAEYNKAREYALSQVEADTRSFKDWSTGVNICSVGAIVITFFVGLCGALAGIPLSAPPNQQDWDRLSTVSRRLRVWILVLSALSGMAVAIGNRMAASASQYQQAANQKLNLIEKCDSDFNHALNPDEITEIARTLETGILHI